MINIIKEPKSVDQLTFTDDGMFQTVMRNPKICAELVERLLDVKINHVDLKKATYSSYVSKILLKRMIRKILDFPVIHSRMLV